MLEIATDKLTERERECLKHIRQARESGVSFAQYCRSIGLIANEWHAVRHGMVKKRLLPPGQGCRPKRVRHVRKHGPFIPVRVESSNGAGIGTAWPAECVIRPDCIIECANWPELNWMKGLLGAQP